MAFRLITGKMGGGKSYWGVEICQQAWADGAIVHSNLAFKDEWLVENVAPDAFVRLTEDFSSWRSQLKAGREGFENVLVIDEGAIMFNARDFSKAKDEKQDVFEFMVHARKLGLDVYFISQAAKNIDAQLRRMAEAEWQTMATKRIPYIGPLIVGIFGEFRRYVCTPDGREVLESSWSRLKPAIFEAYETEATHGNNLGVDRVVRRTKGTARVMTPALWGMMAALVCIGIAGYFGLSRIAGVVGKRLEKADPAPASAPVVARVTDPPAPSASPVLASVEADEFPEEFIMSAGGRLASGERVFWVREFGRVHVGRRIKGRKVTGFILSRYERHIVFDDETTVLLREPYDSEQKRSWNTNSTSSGNSAPLLGLPALPSVFSGAQ